jgi:hypothetical protein
MKTITKTKIILSIAALFLTVAFASPAAAHKLVYFRGGMQGTEIDIPQGGPPPTKLAATGNLPGIATLFGQFSFEYQLTVTLATATAEGSATLITSNGDSIYTKIVGALETTTTPGISIITEIDTITGGTGKFKGAKGFFTVERLANPLPPPGTGLTSGSFHGTILMPD